MNLSELRNIGGVLTGKPVAREVTWVRVDEDGNQTESTFVVGVVKLGVAASERLWSAGDDKSRCAMLIHETIRLGDDFSERIPYEDACNLEAGLFAALTRAADTVNVRPKPAEGDEGNA